MASAAAALAGSTLARNKAACSVIPRIGLGTLMIQPDVVPDAIASAIAAGYRRIDCAPVYFNEDKVGDAIQTALKNGSAKRQDLFLVSKLPSCFHRKEHVEMALKKTLLDLRVDYLDLYLIHWPQAFTPVLPIPMDKRGWETEDIDDSGDGKNIDTTVSIHETWAAMEELVDKGMVKSIGVSNFPVSLLHELMTRAKIPPMVNQVEAHPYLQQTKLLKYCQARGVHFQAYSPLGTADYKEDHEPVILNDTVLKTIAEKHNVSVAQICLAWAIQRGTSVVVKSSSKAHQEENLKVFRQQGEEEELAVTLSDEEMEQIAGLERGYRYFRPEEWWPQLEMAVFD
ncbi:Deoxymugineic acid synthase 1 [Seminavis robusta]|uniref:Deoxymugineic acid synthase 1 n=1 Tax=Seminavis robusta TaxID=568900 RepID=A0A9N8ERL4_9STRA|nr:Deoxymugineic acid synthase 1 [Seminavis robusta]|eukprot:Sro1748_g295120.1 Deoxymugineic acid synthase 1 (341) ;mRNA; r:8554-9576